MPSHVLRTNTKFAVGDTVSLYLASQRGPFDGAPVGSAITTADVAADGSLTFTGLAADTAYVAYKSGAGYIAFFTGTPDRREQVQDVRRRLWRPGASVAANIDREDASGNLSALTSGTLLLAGGLVIPKGATVSQITFLSATTAGGTLTHQQFGLVGVDSNDVIAITSDDTSTAWAANTAKTLALTTPYTAQDDIAVYAAILVTASQVPTLRGADLGNAAVANLLTNPKLAATAGTSLTAVPAVGQDVSTLTGVANLPLAVLS